MVWVYWAALAVMAASDYMSGQSKKSNYIITIAEPEKRGNLVG